MKRRRRNDPADAEVMTTVADFMREALRERADAVMHAAVIAKRNGADGQAVFVLALEYAAFLRPDLSRPGGAWRGALLRLCPELGMTVVDGGKAST